MSEKRIKAMQMAIMDEVQESRAKILKLTELAKDGDREAELKAMKLKDRVMFLLGSAGALKCVLDEENSVSPIEAHDASASLADKMVDMNKKIDGHFHSLDEMPEALAEILDKQLKSGKISQEEHKRMSLKVAKIRKVINGKLGENARDKVKGMEEVKETLESIFGKGHVKTASDFMEDSDDEKSDYQSMLKEARKNKLYKHLCKTFKIKP